MSIFGTGSVLGAYAGLGISTDLSWSGATSWSSEFVPPTTQSIVPPTIATFTSAPPTMKTPLLPLVKITPTVAPLVRTQMIKATVLPTTQPYAPEVTLPSELAEPSASGRWIGLGVGALGLLLVGRAMWKTRKPARPNPRRRRYRRRR